MALTLVLGPANSAKAGEVLGAYAGASRRGALLVVPTALDAGHYTRELAGGGAVLGSVLTFSGLAREIARRAGWPGRPLSDLQRERVLERVLSRARLDTLGRSAATPGFRAAAGGLVSELQRDLVTPQRFTAALRAWAAADERRSPYAGDVARVYREYVRELEQIGRVDRELYAWRALDALRADPGRWGTDAVFFYGFDELTALERDAVETLSRIAGAEVTVSLTYEPGREALIARAEAVEELRPIAAHVHELPALDEHYAPAARVALHHLERRLFEPEPERIDPGPAVGLLESGGERAEAELVAACVLELVRAGVPGEEIVVVYRSLQRPAPLVGRVFAQYGIPLAGELELRFGHTPLGRAVLGAARCALLPEPESTAEDLLDYLRAPGRLERPELADGLEAAIRRDGLGTARQARSRLPLALGELDALAATHDPWPELCALGRRVFAAPRRGQAPRLAGREQLDGRALATLVQAQAEVRELGLSPSGEALIELLDGLVVRAGAGQAPGEVLLAEPLQIRARRFRAVFVCGLQEGEFPVPARPEPFLSDELRHELAACSGLRLSRHENGLARERYLFYAAVSRATERVVLSYRSSDEEGNLALPSPFVADVAELLVADWPQRRARRLLADVVWPAAQAPTARELERSRAAATAPVAGAEPEPERRLGPRALERLRHTRILSAGALETYGDCPMRWLVERELRPERLEPEPEPMARGTFMHDVLERLLRRLGGPVTPGSLGRARTMLDELLAELGPVAGRRLGVGQPEVVRTAALRAIEADLGRYLEHEAAGGCEWRPDGLELRFGFDQDGEGERGDGPEDGSSLQGGAGSEGATATAAPAPLPALALGQGDERVLIRGMIDRVDVDGRGHALVRDYKSGASRPEHQGARWAADRRLQVALYMIVVRELLGLEPVGGFYQPLRGDDLRARGLFVTGTELGAAVVANDGRDPEQLGSELRSAGERAVELATALRSGDLTPCPRNCSRDGCAYPGICRSR